MRDKQIWNREVSVAVRVNFKVKFIIGKLMLNLGSELGLGLELVFKLDLSKVRVRIRS